MKQLNFLRGANLILNSLALIMIVLTSMAIFFGWKWNVVFISVVGITVSSYLIIQSKVKNLNSLIKKHTFKFRHIIHDLSFGIGLVGLMFSIILLIINRVPALDGLFGWFYLLIGIMAITEAIEDWI